MRMLARIAVLCAVLPAAAARAQTTYPMVCRGTTSLSPMQFAVSPGSTSSSLYVYFTRGTQAFSAATLQPGQCTWLDRGIGPGEPAVLVQSLPGTINTVIFMGVRGTLPPINLSTGSIDASKAPYFPLNATARDLENGTPEGSTLWNAGQYWTFNAYNNGYGAFVITSIRCAGACS